VKSTKSKQQNTVLVEVAPGHFEVRDVRVKPVSNKPPRARPLPPLPWRHHAADRTIVDQHDVVVAHDVEVVSTSQHNQQCYLRFVVEGVAWVARTLRGGGMRAHPSTKGSTAPRCSDCGKTLHSRNRSGMCAACLVEQTKRNKPAGKCTACGKAISHNNLTGFCRRHWAEQKETRRHKQTWNSWLC
jgi:ribosomal protein L34E